MPFYYNLHRHDKAFTLKHAQRTAEGLLRLKEAFKAEGVPERVRSSKLLLATWNIREFESGKYGPRQREALARLSTTSPRSSITSTSSPSRKCGTTSRRSST
jgi:hypothetical protein